MTHLFYNFFHSLLLLSEIIAAILLSSSSVFLIIVVIIPLCNMCKNPWVSLLQDMKSFVHAQQLLSNGCVPYQCMVSSRSIIDIIPCGKDIASRNLDKKHNPRENKSIANNGTFSKKQIVAMPISPVGQWRYRLQMDIISLHQNIRVCNRLAITNIF